MVFFGGGTVTGAIDAPFFAEPETGVGALLEAATTGAFTGSGALPILLPGPGPVCGAGAGEGEAFGRRPVGGGGAIAADGAVTGFPWGTAAFRSTTGATVFFFAAADAGGSDVAPELPVLEVATDGAGGAAGLETGLGATLETTGTVIAGFTSAPAATEFPFPETDFAADGAGRWGVGAAAFGKATGAGLVGAVDFLGSSAGPFTAAAGAVDAALGGVALAKAAAEGAGAGFLPPGAGELGARSGAGELLADAAGKDSLPVPFLSAGLDTFTALEVASFGDGSAGGADGFCLATDTFATAGAIEGAGAANFLTGRAVDFARLVAGADSFALDAAGLFGVTTGVTAADCFLASTEGAGFSGRSAFCVARVEEGGGVGEVPSGATLRGAAARRAGFIRFANYG